MKFIGMEEKGGGKFIRRYDLTYEMENGKTKVYEIISRHKGMKTRSELNGHAPDAVILIMYDAAGRILLNREFRMAVGGWVYNFPAGLIDPGETAETAAPRELWEETGLHLDAITEILPKSFGAAGFSDESSLCVIGRASGKFTPSTSAEEEIEAGWYTKEEVRALMETESFASRTQAWCYLWCREE